MNDKMLPKKYIMIVEDDETIRDTVKSLLEFEGYGVRIAENGLDALKSLQTSGLVNLILLDMKMPVMDGWEFVREFVNQYDHSTPILVMTAAGDAKQRAEDVGATDWIGKPFEFDELLKKIRASVN